METIRLPGLHWPSLFAYILLLVASVSAGRLTQSVMSKVAITAFAALVLVVAAPLLLFSMPALASAEVLRGLHLGHWLLLLVGAAALALALRTGPGRAT